MTSVAQMPYLGARFNDFSSIMFDVIGGQALQHFRKKTPITSRINIDFSEGTSAIGEKVLSPLPIDMGEAKSLTAAGQASVPTDISQAVAEVVLNQHRYVEFVVYDREFSTSMSTGVPMRAVTGAVDSLAKAFNKSIIDLTSLVTNVSGGGGTVYDRQAVIKAGALLDGLDVPEEDRFLAMGMQMHEDILNSNINGLNKDDEWFKNGSTGFFLGFDSFRDRLIKPALETDPEPNFAFHRSAITAAVRSLDTPSGDTGAVRVQNIYDEESGLSFRLSQWYDGPTSGTHLKLELLFGCSLSNMNAITMVRPVN